MIDQIIAELNTLVQTENITTLQRFFKTGPGQYAQGDIFIGVKVPVLRKLAKKYAQVSLDEIEKLLQSPIHEHRSLALIMMVDQCNRLKDHQVVQLEEYYRFYLKNIKSINNWDLVDISAHYILGRYLYLQQKQDALISWTESPSLWERRISVILGFYYIRQGEYQYILNCAKRLMKDQEDLIHKAVGWMLREVGKRDVDVLKKFLAINDLIMPRTMLRYAIEHFEEGERQRCLAQSVKEKHSNKKA